jgi:hypothetical protein
MPHDKIERDAELTAIYRAAARDAPPAALDAAILAAARRAVGARPRPAGFSFGGAWRTSLAIAAVIVLSMSLVTLMREEAPELAAPPPAEMPAADAKRKAAAGADEDTAATSPGFVLDPQRSKNIGLKPPSVTSSPAVGMREPAAADGRVQSGKETMADRLESDAAVASSAPARRRDAVANSVEQRDAKVAASTAQPRQAAKLDAPQESQPAPAALPPRVVAAVKPAAAPAPALAGGPVAGVVAEKKTQVQPEAATADRVEAESRMREQPARAPVLAKQAADTAAPAVMAAKPALAQTKPEPQAAGDTGKLEAFADLPPEKWLERIVELRKQGKLDEAKASLAEFRKRYPAYRLPDSLRDWAKL